MIKTIAIAAIAALATLAAAAPALAGPGIVIQGTSTNGIAPLPKPVPIDHEASDTTTPVQPTDNSTRGPLGPGGGGGIWLNGTSTNGIAATRSGVRGVMPGISNRVGVYLNGRSLNGMTLQGVNLPGAKLNGIQWNGKLLNGAKLNSKFLNSKFLNGTATGAGAPDQSGATFAVTAVTLPGGARMMIGG